MLIVLADDFSGAAEIAGIATRYGLTVEIQLDFNPTCTAEVLVFNTDTRQLNAEMAGNRLAEIVTYLRSFDTHIDLFLKVDSVLRGYIIEQIETLSMILGFERVLLFPCNPSKERMIINDNYLVGGELLHQTVFKDDPSFPIESASISQFVNNHYLSLPHQHLIPGSPLPEKGLITGDATNKEDLSTYVRELTTHDLCCGAADFFEVFLEKKGFQTHTMPVNKLENPEYLLVVNGSSVINESDVALLEKNHFELISLPGSWGKETFELSEDREQKWQSDIIQKLNLSRRVAVSINQPIRHNSTPLLIYLIRLMHSITEKMSIDQFHLFLTGGETAASILELLYIRHLQVIREHLPGVVMLSEADSKGPLLTIKPGSYLWPSFIFN